MANEGTSTISPRLHGSPTTMSTDQHISLRAQIDLFLSRWTEDDEVRFRVSEKHLAAIAILYEGRSLTRKEIMMWIMQNFAPYRSLIYDAMWDGPRSPSIEVKDFRQIFDDDAYRSYNSPLRYLGPGPVVDEMEGYYTDYIVSAVMGERIVEDLLRGHAKDMDPKPFRFLDLPPELRQNVYELVLGFPGGELLLSKSLSHIAFCPDKLTYYKAYYQARNEMLRLPQYGLLYLLLVCRQIYEEAHAVFSAFNTFQFRDAASMDHFLSNMPTSYRRHVKCVRLDYTWEFLEPNYHPAGLKMLRGLTSLRRFMVRIDEESVDHRLRRGEKVPRNNTKPLLHPNIAVLRHLLEHSEIVFLGSPLLQRMVTGTPCIAKEDAKKL